MQEEKIMGAISFFYKQPIDIYFEENVVEKHADVLKQAGTKAIIMTGRYSAKACGALDDVQQALTARNIKYIVFDEVENNPSTDTVEKAAGQAKEFGADFVIGIGGGSPIDAGKAVAVLCANPQMQVMDLFQNQFERALPIVAIPTTAGTGSEATQYSVLLVKDKETKLSFGSKLTLPKIALLDVRYTYSISFQSVKNTAVDAFTHCLESYLSNRSTRMSEIIAAEGIRLYGECVPYLTEYKSRTHSSEEEEKIVKEKLMLMSLLGGMAIQITGVTLVHGMGYCYTFFNQIPHGQANGFLVGDYLTYIQESAGEKLKKAMEMMQYTEIKDIKEDIEIMLGKAPAVDSETAKKYTELTMIQKGSISNTVRPTAREDIEKLWNQAGRNQTKEEQK